MRALIAATLLALGSAAPAVAQLTGSTFPFPYGITYAGERPAAVLEEDRQIAAFPLRLTAEDITIIPIDQVFKK